MANMSYCRFENTYRDLGDCLTALKEDEGGLEGLSEREREYADKLYNLCLEYENEHEYQTNNIE